MSASIRCASSSGSTVRRSHTTRPSSTRDHHAPGPQVAREPVGLLHLDRDAARRDRRAPAATRRPRPPRCRRPWRPERARTSASARTRRCSTGSHAIRHRGRVPPRPSRYASATDCNAASVTLSARTARASGCAFRRSTSARRPTMTPGLRSAEQLVARERHERGARVDALADTELVAQPRRPFREPGRRVVEQTRARVDDDRAAERRQLGDRDGRDEPDHAVVRGVHLQEQRDVVGEGGRVVGAPRAVRRADLDEVRARLGHDLGDAEPAADLHELAARHHDRPRRAHTRRARAEPRPRCCSPRCPPRRRTPPRAVRPRARDASRGRPRRGGTRCSCTPPRPASPRWPHGRAARARGSCAATRPSR